MTAPLITVFGAAGRQGGALVRSILADPRRRFRVRAVTRRRAAVGRLAVAGAEVCEADLDAWPSVERAMRGAHGAFCVTGSWGASPERELARAHALAKAAEHAGVAHVVWSTCEDTRDFVRPELSLPAHRGGYRVPAFDAKGEGNRAFVERGLPVTLLYAALDWDDLLRIALKRTQRPDGAQALLLPFGTAKFPGMAAEDVGACALAIFAAGDDTIGKSIGIAGEHLDGAQIAQRLTAALGRRVVHVPLSRQAHAAMDRPRAAEIANLFQFAHDFEHCYRSARSVSFARELHPATLDFAAWLARHRVGGPAVAPAQAL